MYKLFFTFSLLAFYLLPNAYAQNLTGTWEGGGENQKHKLVIIHKDSLLIGYIYEKSIGYCTADFKGVFYRSQKRVTGEGIRFINKSLLHSLATYSWRYTIVDKKEYLIGTLQAKGLFGPGVKVAMQMSRVFESVDTTDYMMKYLNKLSETSYKTKSGITLKDSFTTNTISAPVLNDSMTLIQSKERITNSPKYLYLDSGTIRFKLYDNGTFDGDTVSVLKNGQLIVSKKEVSLNPIEFRLELNKEHPIREIILFAENEGRIPPNTALLIIETPAKRMQLNLNASLRINEKVVVVLKE